MTLYEIFSHETLIGHSAFEFGDPTLGVVFGRFIPLPPYAHVQAACIAAREHSQDHLSLAVRLADGSTLPAQGMGILDASQELGAEEIEVQVVGIPHPLYEQLFSGHVAAYHAQFASAG